MKCLLPRILILLALLILVTDGARSQVDLARDAASHDESPALSPPDISITSPDDIYWDDRFTLDSLKVTGMVAQGDELYVTGDFTAVNGIAANHIAVWNKRTKQWRPLGGGIGSAANAIAIQGGDLYVGGGFSVVDGRPIRALARWHFGEERWYPVTPLPDALSIVTAIAVNETDLYVATLGPEPPGDTLRGRHLARVPRYGGAWERLDGSRAIDSGAVTHLVLLGRYLYAAGEFRSIDSIPGTTWIARMEIATRAWSALGPVTPLLPYPADSTQHQGIFALVGQQNDLYVGGRFRGAGTNLARWDDITETWHGGRDVNGVITALAITPDSLYAGGSFDLSGVGVTMEYRLVAFSREESPSLKNLFANGTSVDHLAVSDVDLYVSGNLWSIGKAPIARIGHVNRGDWLWESPVDRPGLGIDRGPVTGMVAVNEGLCVIGAHSGDVVRAGILDVHGVVLFDGAMWRPVGWPGPWLPSAVASYESSGTVNCYLARHADSTSLFGVTYITPLSEYWNAWDDPKIWGTVTTMARFAGELWCGGDLRLAENDTTRVTVASWDGHQWTARKSDGVVDAMIATPTDLYIGGTMPDPEGGPGSGLARWDGSRWRSVGGGVGGNFLTAPAHVSALAIQGNDLYVAGDFVQAGSRNIARWDGISWYGLGRGLTGNGHINALATRGSGLYAAGSFDALTNVDRRATDSIRSIATRNIARWDNVHREWSALGSGVDGTVASLAVFDNALYVGGYFTTAGNKPSAHIAAWHDPSPPASVPDPGNEAVSAFALRSVPNPARGRATIGFRLPAPAMTRLSIVSSAGIEIATLVNERLAAGEHAASWNTGSVPDGVYFYRLRCGDRVESGTVVVIH
jgi:hypothetical protein